MCIKWNLLFLHVLTPPPPLPLLSSQAERVQELMGISSGEHFDWRRFIVVLAQPLPLPSPLDVVQAAACFAEVAPQGLVACEDYMKVSNTGDNLHTYHTA